MVEEIFRNSAKLASSAHNDNDSFRMVFTPAEIDALESISSAYVRSGSLIRPIYKKGEDISCVIFDRYVGPRATVMAIVKQSPPGNFPNYLVNFGLGYQPTSTINFSEVVRLGRHHLERSLTPPPRSHLSLI